MNKLDRQEIDISVPAEKEKSHRYAPLGAPEKGNQEREFRSRLQVSSHVSTSYSSQIRNLHEEERLSHFQIHCGTSGMFRALVSPGDQGKPGQRGY